VRDTVDEIRECDEGGGKANGWAVQCGDQNFGMTVECLGDVKVVGYERTEPVAV